MKSSKYEYRVVTAPGNKFSVEFGTDDCWRTLAARGSFDSVEDAIANIKWNIEKDDFIPQVVEIDDV